MQRFLAGRIFGLATSAVILAGLTLVYTHVADINQTTVALSLLLAILAVSAVWGMAVSVVMSLGAVLIFNYYFLPPVHTFTIAEFEQMLLDGTIQDASTLGAWGLYKVWKEKQGR